MIYMPKELAECIKETGSCYERMAATFSCLVDKGTKPTDWIDDTEKVNTKTVMTCLMLSSFADMARKTEPEKFTQELDLLGKLKCNEVLDAYWKEMEDCDHDRDC
ncbi:uncharacterized protein LOC144110400 [Amblyomma americanum]